MPIVGSNRLPAMRLPERTAIGESGPSGLDIMAAAARSESVLGSWDAAGRLHAWVNNYGYEPSFTPEDDYDPIDDIIGTPYEEWAGEFDGSQSPQQTAYIKSKLAQRINDRQTLDQAGWPGIAARMFYGMTDVAMLPLYAMPVVGGATRVQTGLRVAAAATTEAAIQETALGAMDPTRTIGEMSLNIGGAAVAGGLLGAAFHQAPKALVKAVDDDIRDIMFEPVYVGEGSVGAARVDGSMAVVGDIEAPSFAAPTQVIDGKTMSGLELETLEGTGFNKIAQTFAPAYRVLGSESLAARQTQQLLTDVPARMKKHSYGFTRNETVEGRVADWHLKKDDVHHFVANQYKTYRKRVGRRNALSRDDFHEQQHLAMIRGGRHEIPEVAASAQRTARLYEEFKDLGVDVGRWSADITPKNAKGYAPTKWDPFKIRRQPMQFKNWIAGEFVKQKGMDPVEAMDVARQVHHSIMNIPDQLLYRQMGGPEPGHLKLRELDLDQESIMPWTMNDARMLMDRYVATVAPEMEMQRMFDGDLNMTAQIGKINDEYDQVIADATKAGKSEKQIARLENRRKSTLSNLEAQRDRILGTYKLGSDPTNMAVRANRQLRSWNYLTMGGNFGIASLPELGKALGDHGVWRGLKAMTGQINKASRELGKADARRFGIALELSANSRAKTMGGYDPALEGKVGTALNKGTEYMATMSGLSWITRETKYVASLAASDRMQSVILKASRGRASAKEKTLLRDIGIPDNAWGRIADQIRSKSERTVGLRYANMSEWDDAAAAEVFENAIRREANRAAPEGTAVGVTPHFLATEWGKTLGQFKRFFFMSLPIHTMTNLSRRDARSIIGLFGMVYSAYWSAQLRSIAMGHEISDNPNVRIVEAIDQSGALGVMGEVVNTMDRLGGLGWSNLTGEPVSRYQRDVRGVVGLVAGPSLGRVDDIWRVTQAGLDGDQDEYTQAQRKAVKRMIPYRNYAAISYALDEMMGIE